MPNINEHAIPINKRFLDVTNEEKNIESRDINNASESRASDDESEIEPSKTDNVSEDNFSNDKISKYVEVLQKFCGKDIKFNYKIIKENDNNRPTYLTQNNFNSTVLRLSDAEYIQLDKKGFFHEALVGVEKPNKEKIFKKLLNEFKKLEKNENITSILTTPDYNVIYLNVSRLPELIKSIENNPSDTKEVKNNSAKPQETKADGNTTQNENTEISPEKNNSSVSHSNLLKACEKWSSSNEAKGFKFTNNKMEKNSKVLFEIKEDKKTNSSYFHVQEKNDDAFDAIVNIIKTNGFTEINIQNGQDEKEYQQIIKALVKAGFDKDFPITIGQEKKTLSEWTEKFDIGSGNTQLNDPTISSPPNNVFGGSTSPTSTQNGEQPPTGNKTPSI
ncbi:MAG: hypothetical protein LEGION0398_MBIBDBAK_01058 [Legionellaceae bacterium]